MTLKEFYEEIHSDYNEIMGRLGNEMIIAKFVHKFENDKSYQMLNDAVEANDYEEVFRAAHTLKGVCQNLGFSNLFEPASELTDSVRNGKHPENWETFYVIKKEYEKTIQCIHELDV